MKAVVVDKYGGPEVLRVKDVEKPYPKKGELLVKLYAAGVNPVDTYLRNGTQGYAPKLPWTPGLDGAGVLEAIGAETPVPEGIQVGSRVYTAGSLSGTYAEYCLCGPDQVFLLPEELDWREGASLGIPYFTAARALFTKGNVSAGESLLVHGASGGVGLAALQLAADINVRAAGTASSDSGRKLVETCGAACFNHHDAMHIAQIQDYFGGAVNIIIEMLADVNLADDLTLLSSGGRVVVVGSRGKIDIEPRFLMTTESMVVGVRVLQATKEEKKQYARRIAAGAKTGKVKPPVAKEYSLEQAGEAHRQIIKGPHAGNFLISIG
ncbi:MAG: hypothetical protein B0D92_04255 [Spirochaeta sp. LUC14_002_19_P3]|nr:MAG: hypothetical protein B0D92_04255 [Spirochaeta sp. LUC14_002_19_P3]